MIVAKICQHCHDLVPVPHNCHKDPGSAASHAIQTNESFIGGHWIENLGHNPVFVDSRESFQRAMDVAGVEQRIKWVPGDRHLINWAAGIDAKTLDNARVLLERASRQRREADPATLETLETTIRDVPASKSDSDGA